jgi:hypothetical protein
MKFLPDFISIDFDKAGYRKAMLNALRNLNERAGQAWIHAAVNSAPIPTWSGASRATFQKLARELGTSVPIGPIRSKKSRVGLGAATASGSGVIEDGDFIGFIYTTNLRYLAYNEYNRAVKGRPPQPYSNAVRFTPYQFQKAAQAAWEEEAKKAKLPDPYRYLTKRPL